jgi:hypothetical protein
VNIASLGQVAGAAVDDKDLTSLIVMIKRHLIVG